MEDMYVIFSRNKIGQVGLTDSYHHNRDCAFTSRSSQEQDDKQALQGNGMVTRPALSASGVTLSGLRECK